MQRNNTEDGVNQSCGPGDITDRRECKDYIFFKFLCKFCFYH